MRWPWQKPETREATGGYTAIISQLIEAQAAGANQQASATAAIEAAAGALSRAFASAMIEGPADVVEAVDPRCLALIGRDLVRVGESLHVIRMTGAGLVLVPSSTWYWEGDAIDPSTWTATATAYGPTAETTWRVPFDSVIFATWGSPTARPYHGLGPASWAADTARLHGNAERSLADEAGGPLAQLLPVPQDGGDDADEDDSLGKLKSDISNARGKAMLVETTQAGWDQGRVAAPQADWKQQRLGPNPPEGVNKAAEASFARMLAACGCPPGLFEAGADGTSQREALRRWHLGTVLPMARIVEAELSRKFRAKIRLRFDLYNVDLAGRAQAFQKLVAGGVAVNEALVTSGLMAAEDA